MNEAQNALLYRLQELVEETPKSGALNAGGRPLHITRFGQAVERRAGNGEKLVAYIREKVHSAPTTGYDALVDAGRLDLTVEALVADEEAAWASEFTDEDRVAARTRLDSMVASHQAAWEAEESVHVEADRKILADVSARRVDKGKPALTPEQEATMLAERAARRAAEG